MGRRGAPFFIALLLLLLYSSLAVTSASDEHGSGSLDLRKLSPEERKDFLKAIELEHVGKRRRKGRNGHDDVKGWIRQSSLI